MVTFAVAAGFVTTGTCGTLCGLNITLGFGQQCLAREFQFAGFGIRTDEFNLNLVALVQAGLGHSLKAFVVDLRDVQQCVFAGQNLNKCTEVYDGFNLTVVNLANLGNCGNAVDGCQSSINSLFLYTEDIYDTLAIFLGEGNSGTGLFLDTLNGLAEIYLR